MKTLLFKLGILCGLLLVVVSCDYKPRDKFFRDLHPDLTPPAINLNINTLSDTVYLKKSQYYVFIISTGIIRNQWIEVYLNDTLKFTTYSSEGKFNISLGSSISSVGLYKLKIRVYLATGTGSIADKMNYEHFLYEKTWWLVVSDNPDLGAVITSAVPENGHLKVSWTPFRGLGFGCYMLLRSLKNDYLFDTIAVLSDLSRTSADDTTYIGEESTFVLKVYSGEPPYDEYENLISTSTYDYYYGFPELTLEPYNEKDLMLTWGRSAFINHISGYKIAIREEFNSGSPINVDISNRETTSYLFSDPKFTFQYQFTVTFLPYKPLTMWNTGNYSKSISGYPGTPSFSCYTMYTPVGADLWFLWAGKIFKYNVAGNLVTDSIVSPGPYGYQTFSVSPNNKYITAPSSSGFILFYNIETHGSEFISFSEISPSSTAFSTAHIADNGIGVASDYYNLFLYDFVHRQLLNTATPVGEFWMNSISSDGQYIFLRNNYKYYCYHFTGQGFVKVWDDPNNQNRGFYFYATDPNKVALFTDHSLSIVNISDWIPQSVLSIDADNLFNIDFGAGRVLGYTADYIRIFNLGNGNIDATLPTIGNELHGIQLKDNYLYSMEGYKLKVF